MISRKRNRLGSRLFRSKRIEIENLEPRIVLDSTVVFNEIMYNPIGENDSQAEWVELFNQLNVDMDISEWQLAGAIDYSFPDGTVVPGRGHLVIASDPQALSDSGAYSDAVGPWEGQLSNAGEEILLYNNDGRLMNAVDYDDAGEWPSAADGGGSTLSKADAFAGSHLPESWTFSPQIGGTIGIQNFIKPGTFRSENIFEEATARAMVPTNGDLGLTWTAEGFDDSSWTTGTLGVGHEGSSRGTYDQFLGLDLDAPPNGQAPIPIEDINGSVYMRVSFDAGDVSRFDRLRLKARYDDGFVAFLNGVEIASANAPGRNGEEGVLSWDSIATGSHRDSDAVVFEGFDITEHAGLLKPTGNILAVQGMNQSATGNDSLFDFELSGDIELFPAPIVQVAFNEVAAFDADEFFIELTNTGSGVIDLTGMTLASTGSLDQSYAFGNQSLAPGAVVSVSEAELGFRPGDTDRVILKTADQQTIVDSRRVTGRLRGRSDQHDGDWLYPSTATPGAANSFQFEGDIVINEIMYHPHPELAIPDTLPQFDRTSIIEMTSEWRYNATGAKFESGWAEQSYAVDNENWLQGPALIGFETGRLPETINTELTAPKDNDPQFITYYFQTDFELTADELANVDALELNHIIDDGAIFYLNGQEVHRFGLPAQVDADTGGSRVSNADRIGPESVPTDLLRVGTNVFSVEVHNRTATDNDIVFGAELVQGRQTSPFIPGSPFRERSEEEWIELYNKGTETVDLSGWQLRDAVDFDFPDGTTIESGEYVLIARDADYLRDKYSDVRIVGSFSGGLSDHDDNILLLDANENPADEVHYYEGGQWPGYADGGAVSLELTDPDADNSKGGVWSYSDDSSESEWTSHSFRGTSLVDIYGNKRYDEFLFGLLGPGEFLIDDVEVIRDPGGAAIPLMQNGSFENDTVGDEADKWRLIGNHSGVVVVDPTDPDNKVLRVTADGAMAHVHDHAETTFVRGEEIEDGTEYEMSFRAKWIAGSNQLNSRLWFNRLSNTMRMDVPDRSGTPGEQNSRFEENVGPVYSGLQHGPLVPAENQEVTIQVRAEDPDSVASVKLFWRLDRRDWNTVDMTINDDGNYQAVIPGHASGDIVQFYVEGQDGQGATSMFPANGPESRALFQVDDGRGPNTPIDSFRMIMMDQDSDDLFRNFNLMSNWYKGITLVHNGTAYYDVDARLIGSRFIRPNSGYKIRLNQDQPFYGVHDSIRFDLDGLREIVLKQLLNRTGGSKSSQYDDIAYLLTANRSHSHEVLLQLARYENIYLNEQFENGGDGTKFELDDVTVPSGGSREGLKTGTEVNTSRDIGGNGAMVRQQGDNPEFYRAHVLIKSNRAKDDYASIVRLAQAIHSTGDELFERTNEVMDVDMWMRHYAHQSFFGAWDTYGFGRPKNLRMFVRPADEKIVPLMWDCDRCPMDRTIKQRVEPTSRLDEIRDIPHNLRVYWGHMYDFMNTSFTNEYTTKWAAHFSALAGGRSHGADGDFSEVVTKMRARIPEATRDMERDIPRVDFDITTNEGNDLQVDQPSVMLEGKGWVDIRYLRLAGTDQPLSDVFWPESDSWQVSLPLAAGNNEIAIEAIDYRGNLIGTETINVTSTEGDAVSASLRVDEVYYHPSDPTAAEAGLGYDNADDFEYLEFTNIGTETIPLSSVSLVRVSQNDGDQGVDFDFADGLVQELEPGASVIVVEDLDAFQARFGSDLPVAGQWSGGLSNGGEMITVENAGVLLQQFTYDDAWYPNTDGAGRSLQILDATNPSLDSWNSAASWRPSSAIEGSPGGRADVIGDSNGDGVFDSADMLLVFQAGEYEDDVPMNSTFAEGDWDGDGDFTTRDIVWVFMHGVFDRAGLAATPSPVVRSLGSDNLSRNNSLTGTETSEGGGSEQNPGGAMLNRRAPALIEQTAVDSVFASREFGSESQQDARDEWDFGDAEVI